MTTITLDDVEYDTDDFTEDQKQMLNEINYNNNSQTQLRYQLNGLEVMKNTIVVKLREELSTETTITESE
tara:strand:- start:2675 stop:2884 length:210 start_codon:yes stop_codon:yes gene_type:complete